MINLTEKQKRHLTYFDWDYNEVEKRLSDAFPNVTEIEIEDIEDTTFTFLVDGIYYTMDYYGKITQENA